MTYKQTSAAPAALAIVGERTRQRLLQHFGSVRAVRQADAAALGAVLTKSQTEAVLRHFQKANTATD